MKAKDIRRGSVIVYNSTPYRVIDFHHHTPGNLRAMVQTKLRNLLNGTQTDVRFSSVEDLQEADVYSFQATFLYQDSSGYHFMNSENYEEVTLSPELVGDGKYYLNDGMAVQVLSYQDEPIGLTLPQTVILEIGETEPGIKGATASNSPKSAKTTSGLSLTVPPFIEIGEKVVVNTEKGEYLSRAEK